MFHQAQEQDWQSAEICGKLQSTTAHISTSKLLSVSLEKLHQLRLQSIPCIFKPAS